MPVSLGTTSISRMFLGSTAVSAAYLGTTQVYTSFEPASLFTGTDTGWAYDLADMSTLFQDAAGTTPVTAVGQPVGRCLDKSGRGNHRTQSIALNRPTYGRHPVTGIRNLLTGSATLATQTRVVTAAQHTLSFRGTGTVTLSGASTAGPLVGTGANTIVSLTFTPTAGNLTLTVSGTVNDAQLETGAARSGYQLVADALGFDVTEAGQADLYYLSYDGLNDSLATASFAWGTDKATICTGVRKLRDTLVSVLAERSPSLAANVGVFVILAPVTNGSATYSFASKGTGQSVTTSPASFAAPVTSVITGFGDIPSDISRLRINGSQVSQNTADQGTGGFGTYQTFFGARAGTSFFFSGREYSSVGINRLLTAGELSSLETWTASRAGVTL